MVTLSVNNERRACDAVARALEDLQKLKRANAHSPEDSRIGPPVEYVFDIGKQTYAMEHTIVEAFAGQIETDVHFDAFVTPISHALDYNLPQPGSYRLFPVNPSKGISCKRLPEVQEKIIEWARISAVELHAECPEPLALENPRGHWGIRKGNIEGVEIELRRETGVGMPDAVKGRLFPIRFAPEDYESLRLERLQIAMSRKLKKLQDWKNLGARSVLMLPRSSAMRRSRR